MTEVRVEGLCKRYAGAAALEEVTLTFPMAASSGFLAPRAAARPRFCGHRGLRDA